MRALVLAALLCSAATAQAAAPAKPVKPLVFPGLLVDITTKDGWNLKAKYNPPQPEKTSFLLLHGTGGRKEDWYRAARPLLKRGYGYLALDLRGHGDSRTAPDGKPATWRKFIVNKDYNGIKKYNEYLNMLADVEAGVAYLVGQGLPEESIAVIGADVGSSLALRYAALHGKVPMVGMLSPRLQYQDVTTVNALRAYKDRPLLMMYSEADKSTASGMPILQRFALSSSGERKLTVVVAPTEHGTKMLRGPVIGQLFDWVEHPVKPEVPVSTETAEGGVQGSTETYDEEGDAEPAPETPPSPAAD
ncbi:MAG: alpha/beta fold hydrolase [Elusimicrobia bacterium]|nr:alpha/beta fold hydrolase [Elusimicrobiota bacterium]